MSKEMQIFNNEQFGKIRTVEIDNKPYFVAVDIAKALGYVNPSDAVKKHCRWVAKCEVPHPQSKNKTLEVNVIPEGDMYRLITNSELPQAEKFESWVFDEVLPQIRKTGGYIPTNEDDSEKDILAKAVLIANKTIEQKEAKIIELSSKNNKLEEKIEDDKHKVSFAEAVENSDDVILVKEMAIIITQNGFKIGQNQLFDYLRDYKYLCSKKGNMYNLPTKKHEDLFKVTKRTIQHTQGTEVKNTPKITGKGQLYFIKKFAEYKMQGLTIKDLLSKKKEAM